MRENIKESNRCQFLKGLNNKTKLTIYMTFGGELKFKRYLNGWVMQELVYSLNYVLECMDLMRSWVDIKVEKVSICVICAVSTVKVWVIFVELPRLFRVPCIIFRESKNNLGNEFEHFKNCNIAGKSHFILGTELWGSRYEELLRLV